MRRVLDQPRNGREHRRSDHVDIVELSALSRTQQPRGDFLYFQCCEVAEHRLGRLLKI